MTLLVLLGPEAKGLSNAAARRRLRDCPVPASRALQPPTHVCRAGKPRVALATSASGQGRGDERRASTADNSAPPPGPRVFTSRGGRATSTSEQTMSADAEQTLDRRAFAEALANELRTVPAVRLPFCAHTVTRAAH